MLKKLRFKFVVVNMIIVTIMLGVIFGLLYFSTSSSLERESMQMMMRISKDPHQIMGPNVFKEDVNLPYFAILVNRAGEATEIGGGFFDLSDEEYVQELLQTTYDTHTMSGVLKNYNLRFLREESVFGECVVYVDMTSEQATLRNMINTFVFVGSLAFIGFLGITTLLSGWAVKPVASAWEQQKQFIADASHELKTPLTVIMTDAELLNTSGCEEEERKQLSEGIITMSAQMRGLVESLLEMARIDNGNVKQEFSQLDLSDLVSSSAMLFEPVLFEKDHFFDYEIEDGIMVNGSARHLKQLTEILLDNAGKYSSDGGKIHLRLSKTQHKHCILEVSDEGPEIEAKHLENLFKRFYRVDEARARSQSYGLGLAIAKSITDEHKGKISVKSADGINSFFVELPIL